MTDDVSGASSPAKATPFGASNDPLTDLQGRVSHTLWKLDCEDKPAELPRIQVAGYTNHISFCPPASPKTRMSKMPLQLPVAISSP